MTTMDGQRFDAWTRALTGRFHRRGTLKALAGMAVASAITRTVSRDAKAFCSEEGQDCSMPCCDGLICDEGLCVAVGGPDCPTLDQSNQCVYPVDPPKCEGNGCHKKKHGKKHGGKRHKSRNRR
jgi:hypothetical protein